MNKSKRERTRQKIRDKMEETVLGILESGTENQKLQACYALTNLLKEQKEAEKPKDPRPIAEQLGYMTKEECEDAVNQILGVPLESAEHIRQANDGWQFDKELLPHLPSMTAEQAAQARAKFIAGRSEERSVIRQAQKEHTNPEWIRAARQAAKQKEKP